LKRIVHISLAVAVLAAVKLLLHLYGGRHYGYFIDELYYLSCARHLAWGYVDQPPLIALIGRVVMATIGDSLSAIRLLPALAGTAEVILAGVLAKELGGGKFAQGLAALCVLVAPGIMALDHFFSMNCFEPLLWMGCAWAVIRLIKTGDARLWLWFGVIAGIGLENKHSILMFGFGLVAGLVLSPQRGVLRSRWLWAGGAIALAIFLPNLIWNVQHHFPFLELQENIRRSGRNVAFTPFSFIGEEMLEMLPLTAPIWVVGFWELFSTRFRALGWAALITSGLIIALNPRTYYLYPAFPLLFAAGCVAWERWLASPRWRLVGIGYAGLMVLGGAVLAPTVVPVLPAETYIRYAAALHIQQPRIENSQLGPLPQLFADQFGWPELAETVAGVYNGLPAEVRLKTAIFGYNYGSAGAIDLFGPKYGLPAAISGHQSYYLWGPRGYTGESMIVIGGRGPDLERRFTTVQKMARIYHPYSMPHQHGDVYYCTGLKMPLVELWPQVKIWQ
jgi:hypothetical protein